MELVITAITIWYFQVALRKWQFLLLLKANKKMSQKKNEEKGISRILLYISGLTSINNLVIS